MNYKQVYPNPPHIRVLGILNYGLQKQRKVKNCFITCKGKRDGAGAQIQAVMSSILFSRYFGITYVHTPFSNIAHNPDKETQWEEKWESFANLGANETCVDQISSAGLKKVNRTYPETIWKTDGHLFIVKHCHAFADQEPDRYNLIIDELIARYEAKPKKIPIFGNPSSFNIAVHLRRGDVTIDNKESFRYSPNDYSVRVVKQVLSVLRGLGISATVHVYSQGRNSDFADFEPLRVSLHINESPFVTFHNLVKADMLIMAKSSFSYAPALLSRGVKIYEPFWHAPLSHWITTDVDKGVDEVALKKSIEKYVSSARYIPH